MQIPMLAFLSRFKLLFVLLSMLVATTFFGNLVPIAVKSFFYAISLSIKNVIVFFLPLIIFTFLWSALIALQTQAGKFLVLLLILVTFSNFISIVVGYEVGANILPLSSFNLTISNSSLQLMPTWNLVLPELISTKIALFVSIVLGLFFAFKPNQYVSNIAKNLNNAVIYFFRHYFTPILPLFILGFLFKLEHEKMLSGLVVSYGPILVLIASTQFLYIIVMYLVASGFKLNKFWEQIKNILPAGITAFSTISSAATMPVTIVCTEKNLIDKTFARMIIPATCNIHALGSGIGVTILALATLKAFNFGLPDFRHFIDFAVFYTLSKYAVAGVPGGVVVVAAPLVEAYLGFTPEMIGILTTTYLLFDAFGTATNVLCNGAFAIIFSRIYNPKTET